MTLAVFRIAYEIALLSRESPTFISFVLMNPWISLRVDPDCHMARHSRYSVRSIFSRLLHWAAIALTSLMCLSRASLQHRLNLLVNSPRDSDVQFHGLISMRSMGNKLLSGSRVAMETSSSSAVGGCRCKVAAKTQRSRSRLFRDFA